MVCLQGASAIQHVIEQSRGERLRVLVVWEPVLPTDWIAPSTASMRRLADLRVQQYWDRGRLLSKAMGEHDRSSIVWDWVGVYSSDTVWESTPPKPVSEDGPVVRVVPGFTNALRVAMPRRE